MAAARNTIGRGSSIASFAVTSLVLFVHKRFLSIRYARK